YEYLIRRRHSCCFECVRHSCSFYGETYFNGEIWYTSACQYCSCWMGNIHCKSVQCQYQFCLKNEIEERRHDSCCVNCRAPKTCHYHGQLLKEGTYTQIDECTLCTCSSQSQIECYEKCNNNRTVITRLFAHRNKSIKIDLSIFTFQDKTIPTYNAKLYYLGYSKLGILKSLSTNSTQMNYTDFQVGNVQYQSTILTNSTDVILLGILTNNEEFINDTYLPIRQFTSEQLNNGHIWYTPTKNALECKCIFNVEQEEECTNCDRIIFDHGLFDVSSIEDGNNKNYGKKLVHFVLMTRQMTRTSNLRQLVTIEYLHVEYSSDDKESMMRVHFEHRSGSGIKIYKFTKDDIIKGNILIRSKADGFYNEPVTYNFNLAAQNEMTPIRLNILTVDSQPLQFRENTMSINVAQLGMIPLLPSLFDINTPDIQIFDLYFSLIKFPTAGYLQNTIGTIFSSNVGIRYFELMNHTLYYFHTNINQTNDIISFDVTDGISSSIKTLIINVIPLISTKIGPTRLHESLLQLSIDEAAEIVIQRQHIGYTSLTSDEIKYKLLLVPRYGYLIKNTKQLVPSDTFTQTDIDMYMIRYQAPAEIGLLPISENIIFNVTDIQRFMMPLQMLLINIRSIDNQPPKLSLKTDIIEVIEGEYIYLDEKIISLFDIDSSLEQIHIIVDTLPVFGYIELTNKKQSVTSFTIIQILNRFIRYVQNDHYSNEPKRDKFKIYATDGINDSPLLTVIVNIKLVNDEQPILITQPVYASPFTRTILNTNFIHVFDVDTPVTNLTFILKTLPKYDSILMSVFDGNFTSETTTLRILIDDTVRYARLENRVLSMANGEKAIINRWILNLINDSIPTDSIIYRIRKASNFGRLTVNNSMTDHFTQTDINQDQVLFEHMLYETTGVIWFTFDLWINNQVQFENQKFLALIQDVSVSQFSYEDILTDQIVYVVVSFNFTTPKLESLLICVYD
ncbi:unnamed protein product, partial [Didymodactylos carnosus]